tara:strand:- start:13 stop:297 length:285 start_codon:yes stop_codon:yes gene_type:complete
MNLLKNIFHYRIFSHYSIFSHYNLRLLSSNTIKNNNPKAPLISCIQENITQENITQENITQEKKIFLEKHKKKNNHIKKIEMHESHSPNPYVIT